MISAKKQFHPLEERWLKADFHLHTKADKEFTYEGKDDTFVSEYIAKLKEH
jgi:hypothetical protein